MASERQIAANKRNAKNSTGPRSASGKRRSSKNAYRHGLAVPLSSGEFVSQLKELARQFAGDSNDAKVLVLAERAAHAHLELLRGRMVQTAIIEQALTRSGTVKEGSRLGMARFRQALTNIKWLERQIVDFPIHPRSINLNMLVPERDGLEELRYSEAFQNILPELNNVHRYAKRAAGRRDSAISKIMKIRRTH